MSTPCRGHPDAVETQAWDSEAASAGVIGAIKLATAPTIKDFQDVEHEKPVSPAPVVSSPASHPKVSENQKPEPAKPCQVAQAPFEVSVDEAVRELPQRAEVSEDHKPACKPSESRLLPEPQTQTPAPEKASAKEKPEASNPATPEMQIHTGEEPDTVDRFDTKAPCASKCLSCCRHV